MEHAAERSTGAPVEVHGTRLATTPQRAAAAVDEAARAWGAEWEPDDDGAGGRLVLPVLAGLRRGVLRGRVNLYPEDGGEDPGPEPATRFVFAAHERREHLHGAAVVVLLLSAAGALLTVVWPFFPGLLPVAPFGALLALGGWFLVITRLRSSGPGEFLELLAEMAGGKDGGEPRGRR